MNAEMAEIHADAIERVIATGVGRAVIDLFCGTGTPAPGTMIHDFHDTYRVDLVLIREGAHHGARVMTTLSARPRML